MSLSLPHIAAVAIGGAVGSVTRYAVVVKLAQWLGTSFPFGTLAVNFFGCAVMGILAELAALVWSPPPEFRSLVQVGFLGGLTTFSSFTLDTGVLWGRDAQLTAVFYVLVTLLATLGGFFGGMMAVRAIFSHGALP